MPTSVLLNPPGRSRSFRPEVEGLRAVAVLLVVADHLISYPRGGFVGVDVFFVISGFLITGLLIKELEDTGHISIPHFYQRRARRIMPAAVLVLMLTAVSARVFFLHSRYVETVRDIGWSAVFLANVHFANTGTDYFQSDHPPSPIQHYWSLSVEEQFYLAWPALLMALLYMCRRIHHPAASRAALTGAVALITAGLLLLAVTQTEANRATAYFAISARAWELGMGAALAVALGRARLPKVLARLFMLAGLAGLAVSAIAVQDGPGFPAPVALLPTLAATAVIIGGSTDVLTRLAAPLSNPVTRYIGRISYSLYLVHFPVIILLQSILDAGTPTFYVVTLLIMAGAAVSCHELVENPLRTLNYGRLFRRLLHRSEEKNLRIAAAAKHRHRLARAALASGAAFVLAGVCFGMRPYVPVRVYAASSTESKGSARPFGQVDPPKEISSQIVGALNSSSFPDLSPSRSDLAKDRVPEWTICGNVNAQTLARCTFKSTKPGSGKKLAVLGDSIGITWLPAIRMLQADGYTIYGFTYGQCPAPDISVKPGVGGQPSFTRECDAHRAWALHKIAELKPNIIVLASRYATVERLADGHTGAKAIAEWKLATVRTVRSAQASGARRIVLLSSPPSEPSMQACTPVDGDPVHCIGTISKEWYDVANAERAAMRSVHGTYLDLHLFFCNADGYCPGFIGHNIPLIDGIHVTNNYSSRLGPVIASHILGKDLRHI